MLLRLLLGTSTIFLSLVLGAFALALVGYNSPETLSMMLGWARDLKSAITSTGIDPKYNIWWSCCSRNASFSSCSSPSPRASFSRCWPRRSCAEAFARLTPR